MFNIVYTEKGVGQVDFEGTLRMFNEQEEAEFWKEDHQSFTKTFRLVIFLIILLLPPWMLGVWTCYDWIYNKLNQHVETVMVLKAPQNQDVVEKVTQKLNNKNIKIKLHVQDNVNPNTLKDRYVAKLLHFSNIEFSNFFNKTVEPLQENITIFFIDEKYWDGEKICSWNKAGGCNINDGEKNIILMPLSRDFKADLQTLNHERTHAYFLREQEIVAHLLENLFANNNDLSGKAFDLYKDSQGSLRFKPSTTKASDRNIVASNFPSSIEAEYDDLFDIDFSAYCSAGVCTGP